jgi:drug/metabolite transporter (DMT)-like permease
VIFLKEHLIKAFLIGILVFFMGLFFSVNLGEFLDAGSVENARANIIAIAVLFLSGVVAVSASLILSEMRKKHS